MISHGYHVIWLMLSPLIVLQHTLGQNMYFWHFNPLCYCYSSILCLESFIFMAKSMNLGFHQTQSPHGTCIVIALGKACTPWILVNFWFTCNTGQDKELLGLDKHADNLVTASTWGECQHSQLGLMHLAHFSCRSCGAEAGHHNRLPERKIFTIFCYTELVFDIKVH